MLSSFLLKTSGMVLVMRVRSSKIAFIKRSISITSRLRID